MMYSGKMETFDGVITVTLINWDLVQYTCVQALKKAMATNNLHECSNSRGSYGGCVISQELYNIWYGTIQLGFIGEQGAQCQEDVECTYAGRWEGAISDVCKHEGKKDESRTILGRGWTG